MRKLLSVEEQGLMAAGVHKGLIPTVCWAVPIAMPCVNGCETDSSGPRLHVWIVKITSVAIKVIIGICRGAMCERREKNIKNPDISFFLLEIKNDSNNIMISP